MRIIEQYNINFTKYANLEQKSKSFTKKDSFLNNVTGESDENVHQALGRSQFASIRIDNNIKSQLGTSMSITEIGEDSSIDKNIDLKAQIKNWRMLDDEFNAKTEAMNGLLNKLGIDGVVTDSYMQPSPQNYSMYYVERAEGKNMLILEMKNGELLYMETNQDAKTLFDKINKSSGLLGLNNGKLSVDKIKDIFAKFFHVDELNDLLLDFSNNEQIASL